MTNPDQPSRRQVVVRGASAVAGGVLAGLAGPVANAARRIGAGSEASSDDALDEALERLQAGEPKRREGLSTHSPMGVEAICALGLAERALPWLDGHGFRVLDVPAPSQPIAKDDWRGALGPKWDASGWDAQVARYGDWVAFFEHELADARWPEVLDLWSGRLAPGLCGAATHGVIRTAHAARALSRKETPVRRAELARGLAYWAAAYQELPARAASADAPRCATYAEALAKVPLHREQHGDPPGGNIVNGLRATARIDGFDAVRDLVAPTEDVAAALSALTATFARAYLRHGRRHHTVAFVHAITGPAALRKLAPHLQPATAAAALPYAWQAAAGIYAVYAGPERETEALELEPKLDAKSVTARAVENGDVHAIKLTDALLAEDAIAPDPAYRVAAEDVVARL